MNDLVRQSAPGIVTLNAAASAKTDTDFVKLVNTAIVDLTAAAGTSELIRQKLGLPPFKSG